jgi:hypothetical protein
VVLWLKPVIHNSMDSRSYDRSVIRSDDKQLLNKQEIHINANHHMDSD